MLLSRKIIFLAKDSVLGKVFNRKTKSGINCFRRFAEHIIANNILSREIEGNKNKR
jgi:hypothetical protein